jgi:hypothetical protein
VTNPTSGSSAYARHTKSFGNDDVLGFDAL